MLIKEHLDIEVDCFMYPYGRIGTQNPEIERVFRRYGYEYAFLTIPGTVGERTKPYWMPRINLEVKVERLGVITRPAVITLFSSMRRYRKTLLKRLIGE